MAHPWKKFRGRPWATNDDLEDHDESGSTYLSVFFTEINFLHLSHWIFIVVLRIAIQTLRDTISQLSRKFAAGVYVYSNECLSASTSGKRYIHVS